MEEERNWFFTVGPMREPDAQRLTQLLVRDAPEGAFVNMHDETQWYCRAVAAEGVADVVTILSEALAAMDRSRDVWLTGMGALSDMQTWLEDEYQGP